MNDVRRTPDQLGPPGPRRPRRAQREVELDETDRALVRLLAHDARTPNNALAKEVGIAPSTCLARVRRLQEAGVIRGFHATVSPEALGLQLQAIVSVRLTSAARHSIGEVGARLAVLPGVLNVFFLAGANDFLIHVAARSAEELRELVVTHLSGSRDVASTETNLIFEHLGGGSPVV
ncbi:MAG: putative Transcriptional regulator, AsnC family [Marmoricola sp.]|nr:putative Transcriptional regulator, AsnC family [Marmoricola sp.]